MNKMSIDFEALEKSAKEHMENQPYAIKCSNCETVLECDEVKVDYDLDLNLSISPCQTCIDEAIEDAKKEMECNNE
jgi:hypothetical protein